MRQIQGAVFDVDGTLLDSMEIWENLSERYLESMGVKPEPGLSRILNTMSTRQGTQYLIEHYGLQLDIRQAMEGINKMLYGFYSCEAPLKEGVAECLEELKRQKIPMIVVTSSDRVNVEAAFTRNGILSYFQEILTCSEMHTDKTKPDIFLEAARRLQAAPADILVFEDVLHALKTAGKAGFQTAAVFDRYSAGQEKEIRETADYYLKTFKEFSTCAAKCTLRSEQ